VASIADLDAAHTVLDIGCGPGAAVRAVAGSVARAVGVDRSEAMVHIARRRSRGVPDVEFEVGAAEELPYPDATFDRVWTIHSYHHWEDPTRGLAEAQRVLRPGGRLLVVESATRGSHGLDRRRAEALAERLRGTGLAEASVSKAGRQLVVAATAPSP
jgi:ubiquinone/menaquinone biosynthesis C-methylase UbiE